MRAPGSKGKSITPIFFLVPEKKMDAFCYKTRFLFTAALKTFMNPLTILTQTSSASIFYLYLSKKNSRDVQSMQMYPHNPSNAPAPAFTKANPSPPS